MSKWGSGHPKALEKREKIATQKAATYEAKQKAKEDAYWHDDDKVKATKDNRAQEKEAKRQAEIERKAELKRLADEEMSQFSAKPRSKTGNKNAGFSGGKKLTKAQLAMREARRQMELAEAKKVVDSKKGQAFVMLDQETELESNTNREEAERIKSEGIIEARSVQEANIALANLGIGGQPKTIDAHPEKRVKTAYKDFEDTRLPELKAENPTLKLSQLRQLLRKEWKKSPSNPMNQ